MARIWHPDLTEVERNALQYIYDCLSVPELLDDNEQVRRAAEEEIDVLRNFPKLQAATSGFGGAKTSSKKKKKAKR
jgi:hypothetical protein